jgi:hypothetical protein
MARASSSILVHNMIQKEVAANQVNPDEGVIRLRNNQVVINDVASDPSRNKQAGRRERHASGLSSPSFEEPSHLWHPAEDLDSRPPTVSHPASLESNDRSRIVPEVADMFVRHFVRYNTSHPGAPRVTRLLTAIPLVQSLNRHRAPVKFDRRLSITQVRMKNVEPCIDRLDAAIVRPAADIATTFETGAMPCNREEAADPVRGRFVASNAGNLKLVVHLVGLFDMTRERPGEMAEVRRHCSEWLLTSSSDVEGIPDDRDPRTIRRLFKGDLLAELAEDCALVTRPPAPRRRSVTKNLPRRTACWSGPSDPRSRKAIT